GTPTDPEEPVKQLFPDVSKKYWAYDAIQAIYQKGIITGYPQKNGPPLFKPGNSIERQHVAVMLTRALTFDKVEAFKPFNDIPASHIYFNEIKTVQQANIFDGKNGKFEPKEFLTRAQMAKVLVEAFDLKETKKHPFPDAKGHWAENYISILYATEITTGSEGMFKPQKNVTRAEFATFMDRALKYKENNQ
uniref:S-layer homology domain-containing protein n=1 Tax=Planococcus sp. CAU13 TaxID=1541197 RepID=UPI00052FEC60